MLHELIRSVSIGVAAGGGFSGELVRSVSIGVTPEDEMKDVNINIVTVM